MIKDMPPGNCDVWYLLSSKCFFSLKFDTFHFSIKFNELIIRPSIGSVSTIDQAKKICIHHGSFSNTGTLATTPASINYPAKKWQQTIVGIVAHDVTHFCISSCDKQSPHALIIVFEKFTFILQPGEFFSFFAEQVQLRRNFFVHIEWTRRTRTVPNRC